MIKLMRKPNESAERLISKFNKMFQAARINPLVQEKKYHRRKTTKRVVRIKALKREEYRAKREKSQFR